MRLIILDKEKQVSFFDKQIDISTKKLFISFEITMVNSVRLITVITKSLLRLEGFFNPSLLAKNSIGLDFSRTNILVF